MLTSKQVYGPSLARGYSFLVRAANRPSSSFPFLQNAVRARTCHRNDFACLRSFFTHFPPPIQDSEFCERRNRLIENLCHLNSCSENPSTSTNMVNSSSSDGSTIALLFSRPKVFSAPDIPYPYRQCSHFLYLSGIGQSNCRLLITRKSSVVFIAEQTNHQILWEGTSKSAGQFMQQSGLDEVLPMSEFMPYMASLLRSGCFIAVDPDDLAENSRIDSDVQTLASIIRNGGAKTIPLFPEVDKLRWIKSKTEQAHMRATCRIGSEALNAAILASQSFTTESQIVGFLEHEVRQRGAARLAYPPVVASGRNLTTIHYIDSDQPIPPASVVLVDAGCELPSGYCSDITRCFPSFASVSSHHSFPLPAAPSLPQQQKHHQQQQQLRPRPAFSSAQQALYDALNHVQDQLLDYVRNVRPLQLNQLYLFMLERMADALQSIVFFKADKRSHSQTIQECDRLCPHHVSHYLGLDVHDTQTISRTIPLVPGVVITVEPGLYIRNDGGIGGGGEGPVRDEFRGLGMRVEDDVLITETGAELLTERCLRSSADIQFAAAGGRI